MILFFIFLFKGMFILLKLDIKCRNISYFFFRMDSILEFLKGVFNIFSSIDIFMLEKVFL